MSEEAMAQVEAAFKEMDTDNDGKISSSDLKKALEKNGAKVTDEDIANIMSVADQDGSGSISFEEFATVIASAAFIKIKIAMVLYSLFTAIDTDGTGYITKDNLKVIAEQAGLTGKAGDEKINEVMAACDKEGDGKISFEEFVVGAIEHVTAE